MSTLSELGHFFASAVRPKSEKSTRVLLIKPNVPGTSLTSMISLNLACINSTFILSVFRWIFVNSSCFCASSCLSPLSSNCMASNSQRASVTQNSLVCNKTGHHRLYVLSQQSSHQNGQLFLVAASSYTLHKFK